MSLADALAAADLAPDVVLARAEERVAQAGIDVAAAPAGSSISAATHSVTARESVAVSAPFRWGGQRSTAVAAARADAMAAGSAREAAVAAARRAIRTAWFSLAAAEAGAKIAAERAAQAGRNAEAVAAQLDAGRATRLDASRARAEAALASAEEGTAEQLRAVSAAALGLLLGRSPGESLTTSGEMPTPAPVGTLEEVRTKALARSSEARTAEARVQAAEARIRFARRQRLPALALEAGADFHDPTQEGTDSFAGLAVLLPQGSAARQRVAVAERDVAAAELQRAQRTAASEAESAWRRRQAAALRFETLESTGVPAAREAAELARLAWREGRVDLFRLLDSERALAETEQARWDAWLAWGTAHADLLWFTGDNE